MHLGVSVSARLFFFKAEVADGSAVYLFVLVFLGSEQNLKPRVDLHI